jgi:hypothetical protein
MLPAILQKNKKAFFHSLKRIGYVSELSMSPFSQFESLLNLKQENEVEQE